jgi:hypothetical protein
MTLKDALRIVSAAGKVRIFMALSAAAVVSTAAVTFGSWTVASAPGNGYSKAVSAQNLTFVDLSATVAASLYPGATADLSVKVTNPNSFAVTITAVSGNGTITSDKGAACNTTTGVAFSNTTGLTQVVGAGATVAFALTNKVTMSNASDTTCQGAVFSVPITLTATS